MKCIQLSGTQACIFQYHDLMICKCLTTCIINWRVGLDISGNVWILKGCHSIWLAGIVLQSQQKRPSCLHAIAFGEEVWQVSNGLQQGAFASALQFQRKFTRGSRGTRLKHVYICML